MENRGIAPLLTTYNSLLHACAEKGNWLRAEQLLKRLLQQGHHPDVWTYTSLMNAYVEHGSPASLDKAFKVFAPTCLCRAAVGGGGNRRGSGGGQKQMERKEDTESKRGRRWEISQSAGLWLKRVGLLGASCDHVCQQKTLNNGS
jgi:pentatricopeptide repeat protein